MLNGELFQLHALLEDVEGVDYGFLQLYEVSKPAGIRVDGTRLASTLSQTPPPQHPPQKERLHRQPRILHTTSDPRVNVGSWMKRRWFSIVT